MPIAALVTAVVGFGIGCVASIPIIIRMFVSFAKSPYKFFSVKKRTEMPACLDDPALGTHGYVHLEEVRIHYVASGEEGKPLMLFLHGFPEFWYSWRYQIREFQKDYRVVAVDMRGYADSDKPSGVSNYKMSKLVGDVKQLIPALGYRSCILVAHDWGGAVAWSFATQHQDMVDKLIMMNCPHPASFQKYLRSHFSQFKKSLYMFFFQLPFLPEFFFKMYDLKPLENIFSSYPMGLRKGKCSKEDIEAYKYAFTRPGGGFTGPLNYYRAAMRSGRVNMPKIGYPVLFIWGCQDQALEKDLAEAARNFTEDLTIRYIEEASHWVQMDTPELVNKYMREFLNGSDSH